MQRTNPPYVADYAVWTIKYEISPEGFIVPSWRTRSPEAVNTVDIADRLRQPNCFLWGWTEIFHEVRPTQAQGQLVDMNREQTFRKEHVINRQLVMMLSELYQSQGPEARQVNRFRSYEQILFDLGWEFKWQPTGPDDMPGAIIPPHILERLAEQEEIKRLLTWKPTLTNLFVPDDQLIIPHEEVLPYPEPSLIPGQNDPRIDAIELKLEKLTDAVLRLVEANASSHALRSGESGPVSAQRGEDQQSFYQNP